MKLRKKGNLSDCNNWRGITLLSIQEKVFCSVLLNRLREHVDSRLREEQAGFRKGRSCSEQIFTLRTMIAQSLEHQTPLIINFIDFKKAFDSIHRESLWKIWKLYIHLFIINLLCGNTGDCYCIYTRSSRKPHSNATLWCICIVGPITFL